MAINVAIFSILFSSLTHAFFGTEEVFAVHVYKCGDKLELLDYKENYDVNPDLNYNLGGKSVDEKMELLFVRMESFEPLRAKMFRNWHEALKSKTRRLKFMNLGRPDDNFSFVNWNGCEIKVLAKATDPSKQGKTVFINQDLWTSLDAKAQSGAYFNILINIEHIVYKLQETTMNSRFLNAVLASDQVGSLIKNKSKLYDVLEYDLVGAYGLGFKFNVFAGANGIKYSLGFDNDGNLMHGRYETPMRNLNWTKLDLTPKFINAPELDLRYYEGSFNIKEDNNFEMSAQLSKQEINCLGNYNLSNVSFITIEAILNEKQKEIVKVHGRFKIGNEAFETIENINGVFTPTTPLQDNYHEFAKKVPHCDE
ncbi:MAG: hypothetical protein CME67_03360 [Halobacteriovoraceae bacterium]|nr:hypothetical protein [Peredibacter sp.]MBJ00246.1 hypothetical protein [Halobacteriovoraceae bacterium]|tara:strand:- start:1124 stop:2224 length:1101 start_codon:yes stop_codon:yes gene_type:complete